MKNFESVLKITFLVISLLFLFTGCDYSKNEIKNRLIIQAVGVDAIENGVRVTLQTLNTDLTGNPNSAANTGDVINSMTVEGKTIAEAISSVSKISGKKPLLSQNKMILFGKETAKQGLYPYLDYFIRNSENRATVLVALSDTTAENIVNTKMGESMLPANLLEEIFYGKEYNTQVVRQELFRFVNLLENPLSSTFLPVICSEKSRTGREEEGKYKMTSVAVFEKDKLKKEIKEEDIMALLLLNNQLRGGFFSIEIPDYHSTATVQVIRCKTKVDTSVLNFVPLYDVHIKMTIALTENETEHPFPDQKDFINCVCQEGERMLKTLLYKNLREMIGANSCDPYQFQHRLRLEHPLYVQKHPEIFETNSPKAQYHIEVTMNVANIGNGVQNIHIQPIAPR